jgi:hypothetical protein
MKKLISIITIMLVSLAVSGCLPKQKMQRQTAPETKIPASTKKAPVQKTAPAEQKTSPEENISTKDVGITTEDLDKLKNQIDGMEFEDLNQLEE